MRFLTHTRIAACLTLALMLFAPQVFAQGGQTGGETRGGETARDRVQDSRSAIEDRRARILYEGPRSTNQGADANRSGQSVQDRVRQDAREVIEERRARILNEAPQSTTRRGSPGDRPDWDDGRDWRDRRNDDDWDRRHRYPYFPFYRNHYGYGGYGQIIIIEDSLRPGDTAGSSYSVEPRPRNEWVPGHWEEVPVEDVLDGEFVDVFYPAVYRMDQEGNMELLEEEQTVRQPKVRIILTRVWVEGQYGPADDAPVDDANAPSNAEVD